MHAPSPAEGGPKPTAAPMPAPSGVGARRGADLLAGQQLAAVQVGRARRRRPRPHPLPPHTQHKQPSPPHTHACTYPIHAHSHMHTANTPPQEDEDEMAQVVIVCEPEGRCALCLPHEQASPAAW